MRESLLDFYQAHRLICQITVMLLVILLFYIKFVEVLPIVGGLVILWLIDKYVDNDHPLRDMLMVATLSTWVLICWQGFDFIIQYESRQAEIFCGKILDSETQTAARQRPVYYYILENQQGHHKTFSANDYFGDKGREVCVTYIPATKSVFFSHDYVLKIKRK